MTEDIFYQREIKSMLLKMGVYFYRVEYRRLPDVYIAKNNFVLWMELKCVNKKNSIVAPDWRPGQLAWIKENERYNNMNICLGLKYLNSTYILTPKQFYYEEELECQKKTFFKNLVFNVFKLLPYILFVILITI